MGKELFFPHSSNLLLNSTPVMNNSKVSKDAARKRDTR
jgi:hypothetical protein